jgi:hypothetical protein
MKTLHGLSAGAGKIGSIIAQGAIAPLRTRGATGKGEIARGEERRGEMRWRTATHAEPSALTLLGASCIGTYSGQSAAKF